MIYSGSMTRPVDRNEGNEANNSQGRLSPRQAFREITRLGQEGRTLYSFPDGKYFDLTTKDGKLGLFRRLTTKK